MLRVGITATQTGLTPVQRGNLERTLLAFAKRGPLELHHGDCIGGDAAADEIARQYGIRRVIHPPENPSKRARCAGEVILPEKAYLDRNHDIVDVSDVLVACPKGMMEEQRSGTWATVRYARKLGRKVMILFPDGSVVTETRAHGAKI